MEKEGVDCRVKQLHVLGCGQHVETVARDCEAGKWDDSRPICLWVSGERGRHRRPVGKHPPIRIQGPALARWLSAFLCQQGQLCSSEPWPLGCP